MTSALLTTMSARSSSPSSRRTPFAAPFSTTIDATAVPVLISGACGLAKEAEHVNGGKHSEPGPTRPTCQICNECTRSNNDVSLCEKCEGHRIELHRSGKAGDEFRMTAERCVTCYRDKREHNQNPQCCSLNFSCLSHPFHVIGRSELRKEARRPRRQRARYG